MHNICEVWLGQDLYSFESPPYNYQHRINADDATVQQFLELNEELLKKKAILWYFMTLTKFNPQTGESTTQTWHKVGELKQKIYLNADAKQQKKQIKLAKFLDVPPAQDDWLVDIEPEPADMP